ncbi:MAG TPA: DUF3943 domain-containing protein [Mucilaginibacter sp.]|jgi:hypothetical protein|nr:DUF3943 domain-containing protein [Mucilaginibacter sp.]
MTGIYISVFALALFVLLGFSSLQRKPVLLFCLFLPISVSVFGQKAQPGDSVKTQPIDSVFPAKLKLPRIDTIKAGEGTANEQVKEFKAVKKQYLSDTIGNQPARSPFVDTTYRNRYGNLLNDDKNFNRTYPLWKPVVQIFGINAFIWSVDRFVLNADFSHIGPSTWNYNINKGWEWDDDRFGINFIGHPYSGSLYFNAARSQGYNYWQSIPFAIGGSVMWEYFGENTRPSLNDVINTPVNGEFLGEIFYRLSSDILDDRTYGSERFFRELLAGVIDPVRGFNRLLQGKSFRHTSTEAYQTEPLDVMISAGIHKINVEDKTIFKGGPTNAMINFQLDYGNPFEDIHRKPFDLFRFRTEFSFGVGRKILDNVLGYGVLFGNNAQIGKLSVLYGVFQYYDYWDNMTFELGAIGFGGGLITKWPITKSIVFYTNFHVAGIPLAGNSTRFGPDTSQVRDYTYNDGLEAKYETTLNLGNYVNLSLTYYYYILHTFVGPAGNNYIAILRPRINVKLLKNLSAGFEHFQYYDDRYLKNFAPQFSNRTEQKIFLTWFIDNPQRKGRYN